MEKTIIQKIEEFQAELVVAHTEELEAHDVFSDLLKKADHEVAEYNGVSADTVKKIAEQGIKTGQHMFRRQLIEYNVKQYQKMLDNEMSEGFTLKPVKS